MSPSMEDTERHRLRHRAELLGESIREIGVLFLVFVPLDAIFHQGEILFPSRVGLGILALLGFNLIFVGILIEGGRQ
jgi:hypothetical protein